MSRLPALGLCYRRAMPRRLAVLALLVACAPSSTPAPQEAAPAPGVEAADQPDLLLVLVGGLRSPLPDGPGASAALLEAAGSEIKWLVV